MIVDKTDTFIAKIVASYIRKDAKERESLLAFLGPEKGEAVKELADKALARLQKSRP